ncbi:MAG: alpha/beta hydrolase [Hyphomicrobium sp.]
MTATVELIMLPGLDGSGALFERFQRQLGQRVQWSSTSYPMTETDTYKSHAGRIRQSLSGGPYVLLGESFGGPIAIELAAALPDRIKGLILVGTFVASPWPSWVVNAASHFDLRPVPRALLDLALIGWRADPELAKSIAAILAELPPAVVRSRLKEVARVDVRGALQSVRCPILALHGTRDRLVSPAPIQAALRMNPQATTKLIHGPHMLLQTGTKDCADAVAAFVREIEAHL